MWQNLTHKATTVKVIEDCETKEYHIKMDNNFSMMFFA